MVYAIIGVSVVLCVSLFVNYNLMKKFEDAEEKMKLSEQTNEELDLWISNFTGEIKEILIKLGKIDRKGSFEADDEIGFFFKDIKKMAAELEEFVN